MIFLRSALGSLAIAEPKIDLKTSFTTLARLAGIIDADDTFDPFKNQRKFLLGAFVFEDVGLRPITAPRPAAGILAVEAYHASEIRTVRYERELFQSVQKISDLRAKASGANDDQGIVLNGRANIVPADPNAIAFGRTTTQVLNIVYLGGAASNFGFFPNKLNGNIK